MHSPSCIILLNTCAVILISRCIFIEKKKLISMSYSVCNIESINCVKQAFIIVESILKIIVNRYT